MFINTCLLFTISVMFAEVDVAIAADSLLPDGTPLRSIVTEDELESTPIWNPDQAPMPPISPDRAFLAARRQFQKVRVGHDSPNVRWYVDRLLLVPMGEQRWYWQIDFLGIYPPPDLVCYGMSIIVLMDGRAAELLDWDRLFELDNPQPRILDGPRCTRLGAFEDRHEPPFHDPLLLSDSGEVLNSLMPLFLGKSWWVAMTSLASHPLPLQVIEAPVDAPPRSILVSRVTREMLQRTPVWQPSRPGPPVSPGRALQLAEQQKKSLLNRYVESQKIKWDLRNLSLMNAGYKRWYWEVEYWGDVGGYPPKIILFVLMDGTVVEPCSLNVHDNTIIPLRKCQ